MTKTRLQLLKDKLEYKELDPGHRQALLDHMNKKNPFWSYIGMELVDVRKGWSLVKLPFSRNLLQSLEVVHGGAIFSSADSAGALAVLGMLKRDEYCITLEIKINFLKPFSKGEVLAEGHIVNVGNRTAVSDIVVKNREGELIAKALATYMVMKKHLIED